MICKVLLVSLCIVELLTATPHYHRHCRRTYRKLLPGHTQPKKTALSSYYSTLNCRSESETAVQKWSGGEFKWPCETTKSLYKSAGKMNSKNVIATKGVMYKGYTYLALPR